MTLSSVTEDRRMGGAPPGRLMQPELPQAGIKEIVGTLRRRRGLILTIAAVGTIAATAVGLYVTPHYTAEALVLVNPVGQQRTEQGTIETQIRLIVSRDRMQRIVRQLDLAADPEFNPALHQSETNLVDRVQEGVDRVLGSLHDRLLIPAGLAEDQRPVALSSPEPAANDDLIADSVGSHLTASAEGRSLVIGLTFTSVNPEKATRIVNMVAKTYVQDRIEAKKLEAERETVWLDRRLRELRVELQNSEGAVQEYQNSNNLVQTGGTSLKEQELVEVNRELVSARAELVAKQAKLELVRKSGSRLDSMPEVVESPLIMNLREQETELLREVANLRNSFGDKHPKMVDLREQTAKLEAKIDREIQRIVVNFDNDVQIMSARVAKLDSEVAALAKDLGHDRTLDITLSDLERKAQATHDLYSSFLRRLEESRGQQLDEPDVQIVSLAAPPEAPDTPPPAVFGAIGFTASLGLGTLLALLLERLDGRLRSSGDVERRLGMRTLSAVPRLGRLQRRRPHKYLIAKPLSLFTEGIRAVYEHLQRSGPAEGCRVVLVTSSVAEEGKTTLATSLAAFAAYSGRRALLVDLDLRNPSAESMLRAVARTGVVECLSGKATLDEAIGRDDTGFDYLLVKRRSSNPTDLLGSARCRDLLTELRRRYDLVVLDSAPLLGLTDSKVAARLADQVVFAIRWAHTDAEVCRECLLELEETGTPLVGVVLTLVDQRRQANYSYASAGRKYHKLHEKYYKN
jgi:succinoglycan biosynthesis transport protein ExoP